MQYFNICINCKMYKHHMFSLIYFWTSLLVDVDLNIYLFQNIFLGKLQTYWHIILIDWTFNWSSIIFWMFSIFSKWWLQSWFFEQVYWHGLNKQSMELRVPWNAPSAQIIFHIKWNIFFCEEVSKIQQFLA